MKLRRKPFAHLELIVVFVILLSAGLPALTTWAQDSGATSFTIASSNGNVVIKRADGSSEMARPGTALGPNDQLASIGRSEATVNLGNQTGGSGATLFLFSDTTIGVRSPSSGGGGFYVADLAQGVVLARTLPSSDATVQITNEHAGAVAQLKQGGMAVSTDVDTGTIAVSCDDRTSQVAFPYTDMRVPCENNVVRTLSNNGAIEDSHADSNSPVTAAVGEARANPLGAQQNEQQANSQNAATQRQNEDSAPAIVASPVPSFDSRIRIRAVWPSTVDYDAHLSGPVPGSSSRFHVFYQAPNAVPYASLDRDVIGVANTPETITISPVDASGQFVPGEYRYWVHNFSQTGFTNSAPVTVTVQQGSQALAAISSNQNTAFNIWYVFNIQVDVNGNAVVTTVNQYTAGSQNTILCANVEGDDCGATRTTK